MAFSPAKYDNNFRYIPEDVTLTPSKTQTDLNGVAKVAMNQGKNTTPGRTTVSAKVAGVSSGISQVYTWVQVDDADLLSLNTGRDDNGNYVTNYDNKTGIITLTFTADIVETSLKKEMINAVYTRYGEDEDGEIIPIDTINFIIKNVAVNRNVVTITVDNPIVGYDANGSVKVTVVPKTIDGITYIMTSEDGMQYLKGVFEIDADPNKDVPVRETEHAKGFTEAFANELQADLDKIAETTVKDGDTSLSLKAFYVKSADPGIEGVGAQAQVTWESSNGSVVKVEADPVPQALSVVAAAETTTPSAIAPGAVISYTATSMAAGIAFLTATIQTYDLDENPVGEARKLVFVVTVGADGKFACMVPVADPQEPDFGPGNYGSSSNDAFRIAFGHAPWYAGGIMTEHGYSGIGIPDPNFGPFSVNNNLTWESSDKNVIDFTRKVENERTEYGQTVIDVTYTMTPVGVGTATLTATVDMNKWTGTAWITQRCVVTYTAEVTKDADGEFEVDYTKVILEVK